MKREKAIKTIRIAPGLLKALEDAAERSGRSANAEIEARLQFSLDQGWVLKTEIVRRVELAT